MTIINYPDIITHNAAAPNELPPIAIALGMFDGVHLGHRRLIELTVCEARARGLVPAVFTFSADGSIKGGTDTIYTTEEKLHILEELGIEIAIIADFNRISGILPDDFSTRVLISELNCRFVAAGYNFRYGKGAAGNASLLASQLSESGIPCRILSEQRLGNEEISSTAIRSALRIGDVATAAKLLGEPFTIGGTVERGLGIGHTHGFPTVNTPVRRDCPLKSGVYATVVRIENEEKLYTGVTNVGVCPTFGAREKHAETMIVDFDADIYGRQVSLSFVAFLRDERHFDSAEALREQIDTDADSAKRATADLIS